MTAPTVLARSAFSLKDAYSRTAGRLKKPPRLRFSSYQRPASAQRRRTATAQAFAFITGVIPAGTGSGDGRARLDQTKRKPADVVRPDT